MTDDIYDYVIVGAGMIGSSTAKYVAKLCSEKNSNHKVALIGVIREGNHKEINVIFLLFHEWKSLDEIAEENLQGAWHDEARITRYNRLELRYFKYSIIKIDWQKWLLEKFSRAKSP